MKTAVVYTSQTGFTKRYAEWIAERTEGDAIELGDAKKKDLSGYDAIVYGGWACAGSISKISWFKKNIEKWTGKKLAAFCVGGSPIDNPDIEPALRKNFDEETYKKIGIFYCPGGFNYDKMSGKSKLMMKMFIKMLKSKKNKTEEEEIMIKMISNSYDISDKKYIEPIIEYIENTGLQP